MTVRNTAFEVWKKKELEWGRPIEIIEVAKATGLHRETVASLLQGKTNRFDGDVLDKVCKFFGLPAGPVPFIVFEPDEA